MSDSKKTSLRRVERRARRTMTPMVLGYTRTGRPVLVPSHNAPSTSYAAKDKFADWTRGEHVDASRILMEHGERETDPDDASRCTQWASVHWDLGGRRTN